MELQIECKAIHKIVTPNLAMCRMLAGKRGTERHTPQTPPLLSLDSFGFIQNISRPIERIFGYSQFDLASQHISCLFPKFTDVTLMQDGRLNPLLSYLCHCDHVFEALDKHNDSISCNLNFFVIERNGLPSIRMIVRPLADADMRPLHANEQGGRSS